MERLENILLQVIVSPYSLSKESLYLIPFTIKCDCDFITYCRLTTTLTQPMNTFLCLMDKENKFCFHNNNIDQNTNGETLAIVKKFNICYLKVYYYSK